MGKVIPGVILIIIGIVFILINVRLRKFLANTAADWITGTGIITAYNTENHSSNDVPLVVFMDQGEKIIASAAPIPSKGRPKPGSEVEIEYKRNEFDDRKATYQVIVKTGQREGHSENVVIWVLTGIGIVLTLVGVIILL